MPITPSFVTRSRTRKHGALAREWAPHLPLSVLLPQAVAPLPLAGGGAWVRRASLTPEASLASGFRSSAAKVRIDIRICILLKKYIPGGTQ